MPRSSTVAAWCALACAIVTASACGGHKGKAEAPGAGGLPPLIKSVAVTFNATSGTPARVFLAAMDETGKTTSFPVGEFAGPCASLAADGADLLTLECKGDGAAGTVRLHAIKQGQDVVVLREKFSPGGAPDPMNRDEVGRYAMPLDAKIAAGQ
jgi:hypothetical protein